MNEHNAKIFNKNLQKYFIENEIERQTNNIENIYIIKTKQLFKELNKKTKDFSNSKTTREIKDEIFLLEQNIKNTQKYIDDLNIFYENFKNLNNNHDIDNIILNIENNTIIYNFNKNNIFDLTDEYLTLLNDNN